MNSFFQSKGYAMKYESIRGTTLSQSLKE